MEFHNKPEARPWAHGINLQTYLWFHGAYPAKAEIAEALQGRAAEAAAHRDIQPWNVILQGREVCLIDSDDPNHAFAYDDAQYRARLLRLLRAEAPSAAAWRALERRPGTGAADVAGAVARADFQPERIRERGD